MRGDRQRPGRPPIFDGNHDHVVLPTRDFQTSPWTIYAMNRLPSNRFVWSQNRRFRAPENTFSLASSFTLSPPLIMEEDLSKSFRLSRPPHAYSLQFQSLRRHYRRYGRRRLDSHFLQHHTPARRDLTVGAVIHSLSYNHAHYPPSSEFLAWFILPPHPQKSSNACVHFPSLRIWPYFPCFVLTTTVGQIDNMAAYVG